MFSRHPPLRQGAAKGLASCFGVVGQGRYIFWKDIGVGFQFLIREGEVEVGTHVSHRFNVGFFLLMGGVSACKRRTQTVPLDGANDDDGGLALVSGGLSVSSMQFHKVMTPNIGTKGFEVAVAVAFNEGLKGWGVEQFAANGRPVSGHDALLVPVHDGFQTCGQGSRSVVGEEVVPGRAPQHFDDVPTGPSVPPLEFLHDF